MTSGITHLHLSHFRSYKDLDISTSIAPVVLYGANGAGKTNILEAISLFAPGRGLRGAATADFAHVSFDRKAHAVWAARLEIDYDLHMATGSDPAAISDKRLLKIQGEPIKNQTILSDWLNILWFTPETDRLFLDSPQIRRRFIDRFVYVIDPQHLKRITRYENAVRQRLHILRNNGSTEWLDALEKTIVAEGTAVLLARTYLMRELSKQSESFPEKHLPIFKASMSATFYEPAASALDIENDYHHKLLHSRQRDAESGMTHIGPHRSDFDLVHMTKKQSAHLCSTGEQKILLLTFMLAFVDRFILEAQKLTLFLLDDVIAHLDFKHRMLLFDKLCSINSPASSESKKNIKFQAWMTGTDRDFFEPLKGRAQFFNVNNGSVTLAA